MIIGIIGLMGTGLGLGLGTTGTGFGPMLIIPPLHLPYARTSAPSQRTIPGVITLRLVRRMNESTGLRTSRATSPYNSVKWSLVTSSIL